MRAGVPRDEVVEWEGDGIGERDRQAGRDGEAERVAQAGRVFDRRELMPDANDAPLGEQRVDPRGRIVRTPGADLVVVEWTEVGEQVVEVIGVARPPFGSEPLELELECGDHRGVEQLTQLFGAEEVAQQIAVERKCCNPALRERCVALVHVHRDPSEEEALREGRRVARLHRHDAHAARSHVGEDLAQRGQVEDVAEAFARRLEQDRERRIARRDLQQSGRALPLLPQRRAFARPAAREQERARRVLPETRREQ